MDETTAYRLAAEERISVAEAVRIVLNPWLLSELIVQTEQPEQIES